MVNPKNIFIAATGCFAALILFLWFQESDTAKIKKRFEALAHEAAKTLDEKELTAALKAKNIAEMCADPLTAEFPSYSISRTFVQKDISPNILSARAHYRAIQIAFYDIQIDFPAKGVAEVSLTGAVDAETTSGEWVHEIHELQCRLIKIEKNWFFARLQEVDVLEK